MLLAMIVAAALPNPAAPVARADCPTDGGVHNVRRSERIEPRKLGELPPADHVLAVYREVDRCPAPVIVRYGIGSDGR